MANALPGSNLLGAEVMDGSELPEVQSKSGSLKIDALPEGKQQRRQQEFPETIEDVEPGAAADAGDPQISGIVLSIIIDYYSIIRN